MSRKRRQRQRPEAIHILPPVYVPMTDGPLEEASDLLAELMIRYMQREMLKGEAASGSHETDGRPRDP